MEYYQTKGRRLTRRPKDSRRNMAQVEGALERAIERPFSRLFRSPLQPAEIEKAALREVEKSRKLGANVIYIANVYTVVISPKDEELMGDLLDTLTSDLATRLYAYASNNNYQMATTRPLVVFNTDDDMKLGEVFVIGENLSQEAIAQEFGENALPKTPHAREQHIAHDSDKMKRVPRDPYIKSGIEGESPTPYQPVPRSSTFAATGNFSANPAVATFADGAGAAAGAEDAAHNLMQPPVRSAVVSGASDDATRIMAPMPQGVNGMITVNQQPPFVLGGQDTYTIGRQGVCDILIEDPQASRQHAQIIREGASWAIADLNSTNGTLLNGTPVTHTRLKDGDVVVVGSTTISYRETGF